MTELSQTPQNFEQLNDIPTHIERKDIAPHAIAASETEIILQRHGRYIRDEDSERVGSLTEEAQEVERQSARDYFESFLDQIPPEAAQDVSVLFVASDTEFRGAGRRSYETATIAQDVAQQVFAERSLDANNILNISHNLRGDGGPRPMLNLREPQMFLKSLEFVEFLRKKYTAIKDRNFGLPLKTMQKKLPGRLWAQKVRTRLRIGRSCLSEFWRAMPLCFMLHTPVNA